MIYFKNNLKNFLLFGVLFSMFTLPAYANRCSTELFTTTLTSALTISDVLENLADECGLSLLVEDREAKKKLSEKLYYVKLNNASLNEFLDTILVENDISYTLEDSKLRISYLNTKTFKLDYISGDRKGKSNAHVMIANSSNRASGTSGGTTGEDGTGSKTGVSIESNDKFTFWSKIKEEIHLLLNRPEDAYEAPEPIVNPEAGMITITGTAKQLERVSVYIDNLTKQLKNQVLIDVKILSVTFDDSFTTGVDWSQLYRFQNMAIASASMLQNNISSLVSQGDSSSLNIGDVTSASGTEPKSSGAIITRGSVQINDVVKFLKTQGDVKSISNPKILTLNNQPALISVGNELFYKIQSTSVMQGTNGAGTQQSGETIDSVFAGILLDITPEISDDGSITLKINPSISDTIDTVNRDSSGARNIPPDLSRKQISSVVTLKDGEHVILGGLISSKNGTKVSKVPLLGDLPLLEHMFKREVNIHTVDELVLIITPHIIKQQNELSLEDLGYKKLSYE